MLDGDDSYSHALIAEQMTGCDMKVGNSKWASVYLYFVLGNCFTLSSSFPVFLQVSLLRRDASVSGTEIFSPSSPARFAKACSFSACASFHESRRMNSNVELCNTPWQINMEPKHRPLCEGKSSSRPLLLRSMLIFQCVPWDASRACFTLFLLWLRNAYELQLMPMKLTRYTLHWKSCTAIDTLTLR